MIGIIAGMNTNKNPMKKASHFILPSLPIMKKANKAEMATPRKPSDQFWARTGAPFL
jgi:hypothetical protein